MPGTPARPQPLEGLGVLDNGHGGLDGHRLAARRLDSIDEAFTHSNTTSGRRNERVPVAVPVQVGQDIPDGLWTGIDLDLGVDDMAPWNSFLWPFVIINSGNPDSFVLPVSLAQLGGRSSTDANLAFAGAIIAMTPPITVFLFAQRYFVQNSASSGIK